jgi:hypothetical protein
MCVGNMMQTLYGTDFGQYFKELALDQLSYTDTCFLNK